MALCPLAAFVVAAAFVQPVSVPAGSADLIGPARPLLAAVRAAGRVETHLSIDNDRAVPQRPPLRMNSPRRYGRPGRRMIAILTGAAVGMVAGFWTVTLAAADDEYGALAGLAYGAPAGALAGGVAGAILVR